MPHSTRLVKARRGRIEESGEGLGELGRTRMGISKTFVPISLRTCERAERDALCRAFYDRVYVHAFPVVDEAEDCATWLPLLDGDEPGKIWLEIVVACAADADPDTVIGGIVFEWYRTSGAWLITYLAVDPKARGRGIARDLFDAALEIIARKSQAAGRSKPLVFAEAEDPQKLAERAARENGYRRLRVLDSLGLVRVEIDYVQPALGAGKRPIDTLFLLVYARPDELMTSVPALRLHAFLSEFYAVLDQSSAPELQTLLDACAQSERLDTLPLGLSLPAVYDDSLGGATGISVQILFFSDLFPKPENARSAERVDLKTLRSAIAKSAPSRRLTAGVESYHDDIVVPFLSDAGRPLVIGCEAFGVPETEDVEDRCHEPISAWIDLPPAVKIEWESHEAELRVTDRDEPATASIPAALTDFVALFESGICAYGLSIVLEPERTSVRTNAVVLLLLESLVGASGETEGEPRFRMRPDPNPEDEGRPLDIFLRELMAGRDLRGPNILSILGSNTPGMPPKLTEMLRSFTFGDTYLDKDDKDGVTRYAPQFVAVEIVGSDAHAKVLDFAERARRRDVPVDRFSKRLAGIVQNVLDFELQDAVEVQDSLMLNLPSGPEITFVHARTMVWFAPYRRAYFESRDKIGSDPYWLLTRLVLAHNEQLLVRLRDELDKLDDPQSRRDDADKTEIQRLVERVRSMQRRVDRYIQNPFRYDSERKMFEFVSDVRGIERQRRLIVAEERTLAARIAEDAAKVKERADDRLNTTVIAIGLVQAAGVFIAVLSLQLEPLHSIVRHMPPDRQPYHVLTNYPVPWLIVFIAASLLVLAGGGLLAWALARRRRAAEIIRR